MVEIKTLIDLPSNVLLEILARLPIKSLYASRCVCKTFLDLSNPNPQFIALYSSNVPQALMIHFEGDYKSMYYLQWIDTEIEVPGGCSLDFRLKPLFEIPEYSHRYSNDFYVVNSCKGLLYLAKKRHPCKSSLVCNPVTNEYLMVPEVETRDKPCPDTRMMMLGYSVGSNQYKVVRFFRTLIDKRTVVRARVHVVGSGSWRDIEDSPLGDYHSFDACCVYLNGVIYWIHMEWFTTSVVSSFDFESEMFGNISLPPEFGGKLVGNIRDVLGIGVIGDCLCVTRNVYNRHLDIWFMKKVGNEECWSKEFVIDMERPRGTKIVGELRPLQVLRNGEIVMLWIDNDVLCYDPRSKSLKRVGFDWPRLHPKVVGFTPSLVPLKDTLLVDKVMMQHVRTSGDGRDLEQEGKTSHWKRFFPL